MRIETLRIINYKSFRKSEAFRFGPQFSVLVGTNNAGKTAALEALSARFRYKPHLRPTKAGESPPVPDPRSQVEVTLVLSGAEIIQHMLRGGRQLDIPTSSGDRAHIEAQIRELAQAATLRFKLAVDQSGNWTTLTKPSHGLWGEPIQSFARVDPDPDRQGWHIVSIQQGVSDNLPATVGTLLLESIYVFRAERMNIGECPIDASSTLKPDASNLASVLLQLTPSPDLYDEYNAYVREVFPTIYRVASSAANQNTAKITINNIDGEAAELKAGISVPLGDSGTGVSQVLAILYVAITAQTPLIIIIDEPNSFLHPGAMRKLLAILSRLNHQYILTTHSPDVINAADPDTVNLIQLRRNESAVQTLDRTKLDSQRLILDELGVRLSDVFGADEILWVEGSTEERCFPMLLTHQGESRPGISVLSLVATGDLESRKIRGSLVWDIYARFSDGTALIPPAIAFALDRESRTESEMADLVRRSRGRVKFLPRRTYENYLIQEDAIASRLSELILDGEPPTVQQVSSWIEANRRRDEYFDNRNTSARDEGEWQKDIDAPRFLKDLFAALSKTTITFDKITHSVQLTEWLLKNKPDHLAELLNHVRDCILVNVRSDTAG